jgi:hypothetical protein
MAKAPAPPARASAETFRKAIEAAKAEGHAPEDLTLHLTHGDAHKLKRDPKVPVADISFAGGVMRFLGVQVVEGGVAASVLERGDQASGAESGDASA